MKLYKDGLVKEIDKEKTIARLINDGWSQEPDVDNLMADPVGENVIEAIPKRRGRPAKVV